jgi:hypothetical protein
MLTKIALSAAGLLLFLVTCAPNPIGGSTETTNGVVGKLYLSDGKTPASGAKVRFIRVDHNPRALAKTLAVVDSATTAANGTFTVTLDSGTYNMLASSGDTALAFADSITPSKDSAITVPPDTLKAPGSLKGVVELQPGNDPRTVFMLVMGTNTWAGPDSAGRFSLAEMAEGTYHVRILSTLDDYQPLDTTLSITAGKADTLKSSIRLRYTGIPVPKGLKTDYDKLKQIVTLTWNKPTTGRTVSGYNVYRKRSDSTAFAILKGGLADTVYRDSTGVQNQTYVYRVAAMDSNQTEGVKSDSVSIKVVSAFKFVSSFGSQGSNNGQFNEPGEMSFDSFGNVYVLDPFNTQGKIHKFDPDGNDLLTWVAGATDELRDIEIIRDTIFVLDRKNKRIKKYNTVGDSLSVWSFSSAADAMNFTIKADYCFVIDRANNVLLKYSINGDSVAAWGNAGSYNYTSLKCVSADETNPNLYVLDADSIGIVINTDGNRVSQLKIDLTARVEAYTQWQLLDDANLLLPGSNLQKVFLIDTTGKCLAQFGEYGSLPGQFKYPGSVSAAASTNKIYIADAQNHRVQIFLYK